MWLLVERGALWWRLHSQPATASQPQPSQPQPASHSQPAAASHLPTHTINIKTNINSVCIRKRVRDRVRRLTGWLKLELELDQELAVSLAG